MKKLSFVLGYAGGILALVLSLLMIYTVPLNLVNKALDDIKDQMENENVVAFNEMLLYSQEHPITDYSENGIIEFSQETAENSSIYNDKDVYEDTAVFAYKTGLTGLISLILIGVSFIFALLAFIGSLVVRKAAAGGGVMMLIAALALLLSAIYTGTVIPMIAAVVFLTAAGVVAFIPVRKEAPAHARHSREKEPRAQYAQPYPGQQYPPQYQAPPQYQDYRQQYQAPPQYAPPVASAQKSDVPFPEEEVQVFSQPPGDDNNK